MTAVQVQICPAWRQATFTDVGHIVSSPPSVWVTQGGEKTRIVFSGDTGRDDRPIIKDPESPEKGAELPSCWRAPMATGCTQSAPTTEKEQEFAEILREGIARGGNIVIPASGRRPRTGAFVLYQALSREWYEYPGLEKVPVYIDSPLGIKATRIHAGCGADCYDDET